jgi:hypothetical protein
LTNEPAAPPIAEAMANPTRPMINTHLRLNMSPSRPPTSSRLPNDSAYAVTTHCRSLLEKPSACWADGSAMFMIVASSTSISWATATTTRTSQRPAGAVRRSGVAEDVVTDDIRSIPTASLGRARTGLTQPTRTPWSRPTDHTEKPVSPKAGRPAQSGCGQGHVGGQRLRRQQLPELSPLLVDVAAGGEG